MRAKQIVLLGAYGQNNLGDDALLDVFTAELAGASLMVNSAQPEQTADRYGVTAIPTGVSWALVRRWRELRRADLVVFGGGSLLKEVEGGPVCRLTYFARILAILLLCRLTGRGTAMIGNGIGPLHRPLYRRLARIAANLTGLVTVRDTASHDLLRSIGVQRPVSITADPVLTLAAPVREPGEPSAEQATPTLVVITRYSLTSPQQRALADACDAFVERERVRIIAVPFQAGFRAQYDDLAATEEFVAMMRHRDRVSIVSPADPAGAFDIISRADLVLSARLHGLIFAALHGVPAVAISYDMKIAGFMRELGQSNACLSLEALEQGALPPMLCRVWQKRALLRPAIHARVDALRIASRRNFDLLDDYLTRRNRIDARPHSLVPAQEVEIERGSEAKTAW